MYSIWFNYDYTYHTVIKLHLTVFSGTMRFEFHNRSVNLFQIPALLGHIEMDLLPAVPSVLQTQCRRNRELGPALHVNWDKFLMMK